MHPYYVQSAVCEAWDPLARSRSVPHRAGQVRERVNDERESDQETDAVAGCRTAHGQVHDEEGRYENRRDYSRREDAPRCRLGAAALEPVHFVTPSDPVGVPGRSTGCVHSRTHRPVRLVAARMPPDRSSSSLVGAVCGARSPDATGCVVGIGRWMWGVRE